MVTNTAFFNRRFAQGKLCLPMGLGRAGFSPNRPKAGQHPELKPDIFQIHKPHCALPIFLFGELGKRTVPVPPVLRTTPN